MQFVQSDVAFALRWVWIQINRRESPQEAYRLKYSLCCSVSQVRGTPYCRDRGGAPIQSHWGCPYPVPCGVSPSSPMGVLHPVTLWEGVPHSVLMAVPYPDLAAICPCQDWMGDPHQKGHGTRHWGTYRERTWD